MASSDFDGFEAAGILWKIGAGVALVVGFGAWVNRPVEGLLQVSASERTYYRDSTGAATAVIRMKARHNQISLRACPAPPVVWIQRDSSGVWRDEPAVNQFCDTKQETHPAMIIPEGVTNTTTVTFHAPGRYRVAVPFGPNWKWSSSFRVEDPKRD